MSIINSKACQKAPGLNSSHCWKRRTISCGIGFRIPRRQTHRSTGICCNEFVMAQNKLLEVCVGGAHWLSAGHVLLTMAGLLAILVSPADWKFRLFSVCVLITASILLHRKTVRTEIRGRALLYTDGSVLLVRSTGQISHAIAGEHAWVSRWISVMPVLENPGGRKLHCLVCRCNHHRADYRRFLTFLRMRTAANQRMLFP